MKNMDRRTLLCGIAIALTADSRSPAARGFPAQKPPHPVPSDRSAGQSSAAAAFHLLTGAPPYHHSNPVAIISQHLNAAPPKLSDRRPDLARLDQVLSKALAKDPANRFDRCRGFARIMAEQTATNAASSAAPTTPAQASRKPAAPTEHPERRAGVASSSKRWITLVAALGVIVLASGVLAWHPWQHRQSAIAGTAAPSTSVPASSAAPAPPAPVAVAAPTPTPNPVEPTTTATTPPAVSRAGFFGEWAIPRPSPSRPTEVRTTRSG